MEQNRPQNPPVDKHYIVLIILIIHGVGILLPWNMFINARAYFADYKMSALYTGKHNNHAKYFLSCVGFASQIPNVIFNWINVFITIGGNLTTRIMWTIPIEVVLFVFTIALAEIDTSNCPDIFFWCTMATVVALNIVNGIYQNTVFGMAGLFPFKYSGAVILGCNVSGTFVSMIDLATIASAPSSKTEAFYYFSTALFVLSICFVTYFLLHLNKFYRYYEAKHKNNRERDSEGTQTQRNKQIWKIFKKTSTQLINLFLIFFVSLSIFPALQASVKKSDPNFIIPDRYYESVMCFLTFNVTALSGSLFSYVVNWPKPKYLVIPVVLRILFVPFFLFCNYQPDEVVPRSLPVLIGNDWAYWIAGATLGFTSGYLTALAVMYTPQTVEPPEAPMASMFCGAIIVTAIVVGVLVGMSFPWIVLNA